MLDLKVPHDLADGAALVRALANQWPAYLAFVTSFATIGIMWINHHRLFTIIKRSDSGLLIFNGLLLLGVTFAPFPTAVLAEYASRAAGPIAAAGYSATYVVIAIFFNLLWRYAAGNNRLLAHDTDSRTTEAITRAFLLGPPAYLVSFALAFLSVPMSVAANLALAIFWALPSRQRPGI